MNFTPAQKQAIDTKNCSLLVAAGAGSGKTRVLTERIIDRILDANSNTDITDFLIVTFTKAAAKEMSERIRKALTEKSVLYPENKKLIRNIALLPQAKISTISSFCLDMIKENYQNLDLSPSLRVAEDDEMNVLIDRITDSIIEERLSEPEKYPCFMTVYETFSGKKSDTPFAETLKDFYKRLTNLPSMKKYLTTVCEHFKELYEANEVFDTFFGKLIKEYTKKDLECAKNLMVSALERSKAEPHTYELFSKVLPDDIVATDNILSSLNAGFDAVYYQIWQFSPKNKPSDQNFDSKNFTDSVWMSAATARDIIKKDVRSAFYPVESETLKKCAGDYYTLSCELSDIMLTLDTRLTAEKKENGIISFSDVERFALELLYDDLDKGTVSETAKNVSAGIKELYIDEYQDINPIQDMIFRALSAKTPDGEECNRFLVGDYKQSIYGFRGARPEIFNGYRHDFADVDEESAPRRKLFMQNNFRCSESVIDFTNMLFCKIMPEEYTEGDRLIFSKISENPVEAPVEMLFCNTFDQKLSASECQKTEAEAVYNEIKKLIKNPEYISSKGKMYELSDVAILTRTWNEATLLEKFFKEKRIPVICERGESFFEREEIKLAMNIIKSVDNPERNICTAGFMRSAICGFSDDELTLIRQNSKTTSLFSATKKYLVCENANTITKEKIQRFLELHSKLRTLSRSCSTHDFVSQMYNLTDIVNICTASSYGALENNAAQIRKKNLSMLYDLSRDFDKTVFKGISAFIEYINAKSQGSNTKKSAGITGDGIKIMTIHKSKGLEFPICFLFGSEKDSQNSREKIIMHEKTGFAFKLKSLEKIQSVQGVHGFVTTDTPLRTLIKRICDDTEDIEDKRLLYVALTRACDLLYITACPKAVKDYEAKIRENKNYKITKGKNQLELILSYLYSENPDFSVEVPGKYDFKAENGRTALSVSVDLCTYSEEMEIEEKLQNDIPVYLPNIELLDKIKNKINRSNSAKSQINAIPPKLTVSLLKNGLIDYEDTQVSSQAQRTPLEMPEFIRKTAEKTGAEKGTAMHTFLQFADFLRCESDGCKKEAERLCENGFITSKQFDMLNVAKLDAFFGTPVYHSIKSAVNVYRELRFNLSTSAKDVIDGVPDTDDFVLVQGVIDCFIENIDGTYTVIDFKTDNVKPENAATVLTERYRNQLKLYSRAVEDMTGQKVSKAIIFSFASMESIDVEI